MAPRILPILSTLDDIAEAIADPPSRRPFAKAVGEAGRRICDRRSANPGAAGYGGALGAAVDTMCGPYWEENDYSPPDSEAPFTGGQCSGQIYRIRADEWNPITNSFDAGVTQGGALQSITGPITSISLGVGADCFTGFTTGRLLTITVQSSFGGGQTLVIPARCVADTNTGDPGLRNIQPFIDGATPDACGDPPPAPVPGPNPAPDPGPIPPDEDVYDDPETGPMLPIPGLPGIPFRNPFGGGGTGDPPGDPGEPGDSVPADGIGGGAGAADAEGTAPPGSELVALRLDLVSVLPNFPDIGNGDYRAAAFIRMGTVAGLDLDLGGAIVRDGQLFYAETPGQTKWRVTANVGISWLVTPFYREVN